jgi:hypothetical protein
MKQLHTEIQIDAPAEVVWEILLDFRSYPAWNPFVRSITGAARTGSSLSVVLQLPGRRPTTMHPKVIRILGGRELRWKGKLLMPGIFDGEHWFMIYPLGADKVRFVQGEAFGGVLMPVIYPMIRKITRSGFEGMNRALKERAEQVHASQPSAG